MPGGAGSPAAERRAKSRTKKKKEDPWANKKLENTRVAGGSGVRRKINVVSCSNFSCAKRMAWECLQRVQERSDKEEERRGRLDAGSEKLRGGEENT